MTPEAAAAAFWAAYIRNRNVDERTAADGALPVAGGFALYVAGTAFERVIGAGWDRPLRSEDCALVEEFYVPRGVVPSFELSTEAAERDAAVLLARGYVVEPEARLAVYEMPVPSPAPGDLASARVTRDRRAWAALLGAALSTGTDDEELGRTLNFVAGAASVLVVAAAAGRDVAAGGLLITAEFGLFVSGGVLPEARRRGLHGALLAARLRLAYERGATRAALKTRVGSPAEQTAVRAGFARTALIVRATRTGG